jgi:hypothetical protein
VLRRQAAGTSDDRQVAVFDEPTAIHEDPNTVGLELLRCNVSITIPLNSRKLETDASLPDRQRPVFS